MPPSRCPILTTARPRGKAGAFPPAHRLLRPLAPLGERARVRGSPMLRPLSQRATPHSELGARGAPYPPAGHPLPRGARVLLAAPLAIFPCPSSPRPFGERARVRGPPLRSAKLIPAPAFGPILAASPRQTRGRDERLARGRSGYPGRRILAEDETGVDDCRRAEPVWCWTFLPAPPGPARPRVPPSRMAWAAAAPTARRQA